LVDEEVLFVEDAEEGEGGVLVYAEHNATDGLFGGDEEVFVRLM